MTKKIAIIHTGGTIAMEENQDTGGVTPTAKHPLSDALKTFKAPVSFVEEQLFNIPSPHMTPEKMLHLAHCIREKIEKESCDGIVITHGTDTLEETAFFLDLVTNFKEPIVVTGSMRSSNEPGYDGFHNLIISIKTAMSDGSTNKGVLVVLNDEIHSAKNVTKTHTSNVATFQSPQFGPIGIVTKRGVFFHHQPSYREHYNIKAISKKTTLLKAYAGMGTGILTSIVNLGYNGIVIEAFGQGNLPPNLGSEIEAVIRNGVPIVIVSRCFNGIVSDIYAYEGGGAELKEKGVILSNGLNGQKARMKLLIALEQTNDTQQLQAIFNR